MYIDVVCSVYPTFGRHLRHLSQVPWAEMSLHFYGMINPFSFIPKKSVAELLRGRYCIAMYVKAAALAHFSEMLRSPLPEIILQRFYKQQKQLSVCGLLCVLMFRHCKTEFSLVIHNCQMEPLLLHSPKSVSKVFPKAWYIEKQKINSAAICLCPLWVQIPFRNSEYLQILSWFYELFKTENRFKVAFVQWENTDERWFHMSNQKSTIAAWILNTDTKPLMNNLQIRNF